MNYQKFGFLFNFDIFKFAKKARWFISQFLNSIVGYNDICS